VEDEIADRETVNEVYKLATNSPAGVFDIAEMLGYERILEALEEIYAKTGLEVFRPAESLKLMK
jgi:3-hydroxyacyl-CoA dehydrogenase